MSSDTERTSRLPSSIPPPHSAATSALPAAADPQRRWAVEMTRQINELREEIHELTRIATRCFEELQRQSGRIRALEGEVEDLKARVTLLPKAPDERDLPTNPENVKPHRD